jgi:dethiobiotin synthetase/adenosylmethionine--8-amino-7-oxononanoate aminotransferase
VQAVCSLRKYNLIHSGPHSKELSDPLFQRTLIEVVRKSSDLFARSSSVGSSSTPPSGNKESWSGLPVIHDEVFTGLYRLGRFSSSSFLKSHPDLSVHAKLLTGGLLPLCTTVASDSIYEAFLSTEKKDALLHGHSYTAHAIGCEVAKTSIGIMRDLEDSGKWDRYKSDWMNNVNSSKSQVSTPDNGLWSSWSKDFVTDLSYKEQVESVMALGTVLAINLLDQENAGMFVYQ